MKFRVDPERCRETSRQLFCPVHNFTSKSRGQPITFQVQLTSVIRPPAGGLPETGIVAVYKYPFEWAVGSVTDEL